MDHTIEYFQYGLHSTLWVLGKDVQAPGVTPPHTHTSVHSVTLPLFLTYGVAPTSISQQYERPE